MGALRNIHERYHALPLHQRPPMNKLGDWVALATATEIHEIAASHLTEAEILDIVNQPMAFVDDLENLMRLLAKIGRDYPSFLPRLLERITNGRKRHS